MVEKSDTSENQKQSGRKRHLWLWFVAGFLMGFLAMSLTITMYSMHPSGNAVVGCKLWEYYLIEIQRALSSSGNLGPATGSSSAAVTTAFQHILFSAVGGAVMLGIGWGVCKIKGRKGGESKVRTTPSGSSTSDEHSESAA
jgi:hypothetical protein